MTVLPMRFLAGFNVGARNFTFPPSGECEVKLTELPFSRQVFGFSDPIGCECAPARTLIAVSCQMGDIRSMFLRCGLTLKRAGSLTCCVSQQANHNRERGSKEKGLP